jgi:hypothetical protein
MEPPLHQPPGCYLRGFVYLFSRVTALITHRV